MCIRTGPLRRVACISFSFSSSNVSVHRRRLVRRTVERLVGLFIWFSAVLLWPIVLNVTVWSLFFALSMWKVHCTCGSLLFICPTSAFTFAPLVARKVERLVGFHFHWLFLASLFQIVSAGFVTIVFQWWKVHCARGCQYIHDPTSGFWLRRALAPIARNPLFGVFIVLRLYKSEMTFRGI